MVLREFGLNRVRLHLSKQMSWKVIAIEIERTQIHFLSNVFVAVAVVVS